MDIATRVLNDVTILHLQFIRDSGLHFYVVDRRGPGRRPTALIRLGVLGEQRRR